MCDTLVVMPESTTSGDVLFAKNSDRDPNEAQLLEYIHAEEHLSQTKLKCTHIEIPQVKNTNGVLLSRPFWIWGAEMGANDKGVVIGNEAVFTKVPQEKTPGLIGMDLLRLGLERGNSAKEALHVITGLLEEFGQTGNCGFSHEFQYHNSFIIADRHEAWVLETAGREWAAQKATSIRSISNAITIGSEFDFYSENLVKKAVDNHWCKDEKSFSFKDAYSDLIFTTFSDARYRQACTTEYMLRKKSKIDLSNMMSVLQSHKKELADGWSPDNRLAGADVCMHFGFGPIRINQTTGSMVSQLGANDQTHWVTGTASPCLSIFKPVWMSAGIPDQGASPVGTYDSESLWWAHERLHRTTVMAYQERQKAFAAEQAAWQASLIQAGMALANASSEEKQAYSKQAFAQSRQLTEKWTQQAEAVQPRKRPAFYFQSAWKKINREGNYPEK